ncbi:hypothetical protein QTP88_026335 [Uroleucon formosanum]
MLKYSGLNLLSPNIHPIIWDSVYHSRWRSLPDIFRLQLKKMKKNDNLNWRKQCKKTCVLKCFCPNVMICYYYKNFFKSQAS